MFLYVIIVLEYKYILNVKDIYVGFVTLILSLYQEMV